MPYSKLFCNLLKALKVIQLFCSRFFVPHWQVIFKTLLITNTCSFLNQSLIKLILKKISNTWKIKTSGEKVKPSERLDE